MIEAFQQPFRREVGGRSALLPLPATEAIEAVTAAATTITIATTAGSVPAAAAATASTAKESASTAGISSGGGGKRHRSGGAADDDAALLMTAMLRMGQRTPRGGESSEPAGTLSRSLEEVGQGAELVSTIVTDAQGQQEEEEGEEEEGEEGDGDELLYQATQMLASSSRPAAEGSEEDDAWGQDGDDDGA